MGDGRANNFLATPFAPATNVDDDNETESMSVGGGGDLEQQMLAVQQLYQQKQADLLLHFQQSQAQLALQHIRISQELFQQYVQRRNQQQQNAAAAIDDQNQPSDDRDAESRLQSTRSESHLSHPLDRSAAGGSSGTISARTREKLKAMIKQRHRTTSNSGSPLYEPYPRPNNDDHELRKATSEPNLKLKGVAALRAKLMERNAPSSRRYDADDGALGAPPTGQTSAPVFFTAPSLPNLPTHQFVTDLPLPHASQELLGNALFFAAPSLAPYLAPWATNFTGQGPSIGGNHIKWAGSADNLTDPNADRAFRPFDRRHMTVTLPPSQHGLLRQQLRDLVLRRKSLVREETEDDIKKESSYSSLASVAEVSSDGQASFATNFDRKTTGLAYDSMMCRHQCTCGDNSQHVEHGGRVQSIWARLQETGLVDECEKIMARKAPLDYLRLCHGDSYTTFFAVSPTACLKMDASDLPLKSFVQLPCGGIGVDSDTYFNDTFTPAAARSAVGCVVELCLAVGDGRLKNGFAVVRPPGHHAEPNQAVGFCYFNNVAIAAKVVQQKLGLKKIAVVDWDVHHGNGTQLIFETDPSVLYISLHRHDDGNFFPGTGAITEVGKGEGEGFNVNIAWSGEPMGDAEYLAAWRSVVTPILDAFRPQFILVSCGFDAARGHWNALGGYNLSSRMYGWMTRSLLNYAEGRVVLVLEGGYDLAAISEATECCVRALLAPTGTNSEEKNHEFCRVSKESCAAKPNKSARTTIEKVVEAHKRYWPFLSSEGVDLSHKERESLGRQFANLSVTRSNYGAEAAGETMRSDSENDDDDVEVEVEIGD